MSDQNLLVQNLKCPCRSAAPLLSPRVRLLSHSRLRPPDERQPGLCSRRPAGGFCSWFPAGFPPGSGFCNGWFCADPGVLPEAEGVHRVEPAAAETRTAPQVAAEGHAHHRRHLQPQQPGAAGSERRLHVRRHRPDPGTAPLRPSSSGSRGLSLLSETKLREDRRSTATSRSRVYILN